MQNMFKMKGEIRKYVSKVYIVSNENITNLLLYYVFNLL